MGRVGWWCLHMSRMGGCICEYPWASTALQLSKASVCQDSCSLNLNRENKTLGMWHTMYSTHYRAGARRIRGSKPVSIYAVTMRPAWATCYPLKTKATERKA